MHPARLQAGVNNGDFDQVGVVADQDQRTSGWHSSQGFVVDAA